MRRRIEKALRKREVERERVAREEAIQAMGARIELQEGEIARLKRQMDTIIKEVISVIKVVNK